MHVKFNLQSYAQKPADYSLQSTLQMWKLYICCPNMLRHHSRRRIYLRSDDGDEGGAPSRGISAIVLTLMPKPGFFHLRNLKTASPLQNLLLEM